LTYSQQKQFIPVASKPVLFYAIEDVIEVGIHDIGIIVEPNKEQVIETVKSVDWDANIEFIYQGEPKGLAHAILVAKDIFFLVHNHSSVFSTSVIITTFFAVLFGIIFIAGIDTRSPQLVDIVRRYVLLYLISLAANSIMSLTGVSFIALRRLSITFFKVF